MHISSIQNIKFKGSVERNKAALAKEIVKFNRAYNQNSDADYIVGGLNNLYLKLINETPRDNRYKIDFNVTKIQSTNAYIDDAFYDSDELGTADYFCR